MGYFWHMTQSVFRLLLVAAMSAFLASCASSGKSASSSGESSDGGGSGAEILDKAARKVAVNYRENCYEPVARKKVPSELCQYQLFEKAERQWGPEFGKTELIQTANRYQGDQIEVAIMKILVYDKTAQRDVSSNKSTRYEIIQQLKDKYKIR